METPFCGRNYGAQVSPGIADQLLLLGAGSALGLLKNQKVEMPGVELALVDPESLCVGDSLYAT